MKTMSVCTYINIYACVRYMFKSKKPFVTDKVPMITCLKISSSSRLRLSSTCLRPLSSASLIRLCLSANIEKACILLSSWSLVSSLLRKSNISPRLCPSTLARASSTWDSWIIGNKHVLFAFIKKKNSIQIQHKLLQHEPKSLKICTFL